jgi:2-polyprenyl-6-methoxyphenol hydroxylase-like FAD-dependent oxidoreductase
MVHLNPNTTPAADVSVIEHAKVIIVGAGPVGLFLALKLAKAGIQVMVLEAENAVLQSPRATT